MRAREYQTRAVDGAFKEWETHNSTLIVQPTGTGKTVVAALIIKRIQPKRTIFVAHRDTLIFQAKETIEAVAGVSCGIEMAGSRADATFFGRDQVVLTSVQTQLARCNGDGRMTRFDPMDYDLVILDEAPHYVSPAWRKVPEYYRRNPNLKCLGLTATPDRLDEIALGQLFESVAFDYEILDAIHDGWLVPVDQQMVNIADLDYSEVRTTAGDLNGGDLARVMEEESVMQGIVGASIDIIGNRKSILFTTSVKQAEQSADIFNRHKPGMAGWICDKTPRDECRKIIEELKHGGLQVVCNVGKLTEGADVPTVQCVLMGRPTESRSLYTQMVGRGTRPLKGVVDGPPTADERKAAIAASAKPSMLVVDFCGNSGKHKLMTSADILGGKMSDEVIARAVKLTTESGKAVRMSDMLDAAQLELLRKAEEEQKRLEAARKNRLVAQVRYNRHFVDPFNVLDIAPTRSRGWDTGRKLSTKQVEILRKQGINPDGMEYHQSKQLIDEIFRRVQEQRCSFKQAKLLKSRGYDSNVSCAEASALIDIIANKEGWAKKKEPVPA